MTKSSAESLRVEWESDEERGGQRIYTSVWIVSPNPYSTALKGQFQIHRCFRTGVGKLLDLRATIGPRIERGRGRQELSHVN